MAFLKWFIRFLNSSIGGKILMSLTGLFLILFLAVHLLGNLQLVLFDDQGKQFNLYAEFMTTNPIIKTTSYLLYFTILLHAIQGMFIWRKNRAARGPNHYDKKVAKSKGTHTFSAQNMGWLGVIIFLFIIIHLWQFWFQMKIGALPMVNYDGQMVNDLYTPVAAAFSNIWFVIFYVFSMLVIAGHLLHGFQSAFQTLGLNDMKIGILIRFLGKLYAIFIPLGFAFIPVYMYYQLVLS